MALLAHDYQAIARQAPLRGAPGIVAYLDRNLPVLWQSDYEAGVACDLLTVTFGGGGPDEPFSRYLFHHAGDGAAAGASGIDDRVVAVWGLSRPEPAATRDRSRLRGFLQSVWSAAYPGADRGHFLAHTLGGGLDINLFPQSRVTNRGGLWRKMETYATRNPGTFCFVRPVYRDETWVPAALEFGIFKTASPDPAEFWGHVFENDLGLPR